MYNYTRKNKVPGLSRRRRFTAVVDVQYSPAFVQAQRTSFGLARFPSGR